jgi:2-isopropylmalate synthase
MDKLHIFDTTLRDGEQAPGNDLNTDEKVEVARLLEDLGVNTIEAGCAANIEHDYEAIKKVAEVTRKFANAH